MGSWVHDRTGLAIRLRLSCSRREECRQGVGALRTTRHKPGLFAEVSNQTIKPSDRTRFFGVRVYAERWQVHFPDRSSGELY